MVVHILQSQSPNLYPCAHTSILYICISIPSLHVGLLFHFYRFHIYAFICDIYFSLSERWVFRGKYFEVEKDKHKDRSTPGALKKTRRAEEEVVWEYEEEMASEWTLGSCRTRWGPRRFLSKRKKWSTFHLQRPTWPAFTAVFSEMKGRMQKQAEWVGGCCRVQRSDA